MSSGDCFPLFAIFLNHVFISEEWDLHRDDDIIFIVFSIKESFHEHPE